MKKSAAYFKEERKLINNSVSDMNDILFNFTVTHSSIALREKTVKTESQSLTHHCDLVTRPSMFDL